MYYNDGGKLTLAAFTLPKSSSSCNPFSQILKSSEERAITSRTLNTDGEWNSLYSLPSLIALFVQLWCEVQSPATCFVIASLACLPGCCEDGEGILVFVEGIKVLSTKHSRAGRRTHTNQDAYRQVKVHNTCTCVRLSIRVCLLSFACIPCPNSNRIQGMADTS